MIKISLIFPSKIIKQYEIKENSNISDLIKIIINDNQIEKPLNEIPTLLFNGNVLNKELLIKNIENYELFPFRIIFKPTFNDNDQASASELLLLRGFDDLILNDNNRINQNLIEDLTFLLPGFNNQENDLEFDENNLLLCCPKSFWIGFLFGLVGGPFSFMILTCRQFNISGLIGIFLGMCVWLFFMFFYVIL